MGSSRKAAVRDLASTAHALEASVLEGRLARSSTGAWTVDDAALSEWLADYEGQEVVLIAASLEDERPLPVRTCRTCGAEYDSPECHRCRDALTRLRGPDG